MHGDFEEISTHSFELVAATFVLLSHSQELLSVRSLVITQALARNVYVVFPGLTFLFPPKSFLTFWLLNSTLSPLRLTRRVLP